MGTLHRASHVLEDIEREMRAQVDRWGYQSHPDGTPGMWRSTTLDPLSRKVATDVAAANGTVTWAHILTEEVAEALDESDPVLLRTELVQAAAVIGSWIRDIDSREDAA